MLGCAQNFQASIYYPKSIVKRMFDTDSAVKLDKSAVEKITSTVNIISAMSSFKKNGIVIAKVLVHVGKCFKMVIIINFKFL